MAGCAQLGYYTQLARGQMELLSKRERIADIVGNPERDPELRRRLALVLDARRFAIATLSLPDNASYTLYADLGRPYALWNVMATPEFSLEPIESCFLIAGCVAYRGHYSRARADSQVEALRAQGYDVDIGGVPAYSTLGWFDDPVLSTMLHWSDEVLIGTVFHELTHQKFYLKGDTAFDESLATFVEGEGLRQYLAARKQPSDAHRLYKQRQQQFVALMLGAREQLGEIYAAPFSTDDKGARKQAVFDALEHNYRALRDGAWQGFAGYDRWFDGGLNNAKLLPFGLYELWTPAFAAIYAQAGERWPAFYQAVAELAKLAEPQRHARLDELTALQTRPLER